MSIYRNCDIHVHNVLLFSLSKDRNAVVWADTDGSKQYYAKLNKAAA